MNKPLFIVLLTLLFNRGSSQTDTLIHFHAFGGLNNDLAEEVYPTSDGGYVVVGSASSNSWGNTDVYLLKVDSLCNYEWSKALGGSGNDWGHAVQQTHDKGYIVALNSNSYGNGGYDACLMKRDSLGNYQWKKTYGGPDWDFVYSVAQTYDSGYVFCGETYNGSNGFSDVYIVKTDELGDTLWTKKIGGNLVDKGMSVIETSDSSIVVAGVSNSVTDSSDSYVIKLEKDGGLIWEMSYLSPNYQSINQIIEMSTGNYVMVGNSDGVSINGDLDYLIHCIEPGGNTLWIQELVNPGPLADDEDALSIVELPSNNLLVSGYTKTGGNGEKSITFFELLPTGFWAGNSVVVGSINDDVINRIVIGNDGSIVGAGFTTDYGAGMEDVLLTQLDTVFGGQSYDTTSTLDLIPLGGFNGIHKDEIMVYPNPFESELFVKHELQGNQIQAFVFEVSGKLLYRTELLNGRINLDFLKSGVYMLEIVATDYQVFRSKILKN